MADRFFLTTAIAYANSRPGLHTLFEVVAADAIARWHRMLGDETFFLTGTDEYSVNIAMTAAARGESPKAFVDAQVELFRRAEDALGIAPDRFIRTTDPDHQQAVHEMVRRAYANGDLYVGTYEGWYCPNEGFIPSSQLVEDIAGTHCANHPGVELQWLSERNWFFRLSAYQERLERYFAEHPEWVQPDYRRNEMLGFMRGGLEDFSVSREGAPWGIPFPIREDGSSAQLPDGSWDPAAGTVYVWFDALTNYLTGVGFPDSPDRFGRWWPADLQVIGKDINRLHTIMWPAMLMSAGLPLPRLVWVHGWLLVQGERMSKSRGNFLDPLDVVAALGQDGARYCTLREVAFDRDSDVSWDSFVRRYNADLANDFGNLVNRTVTMVRRYLGGTRPPATPGGNLARAWGETLPAYRGQVENQGLSDALATLFGFVGAANREVDACRPWDLAKAARDGDTAADQRLRELLGDLVEGCRLVALAAAPFMPATAPRALAQLGHPYPYGPDGNGGPALLDELAWAAHADEPAELPDPTPLFPRLEVEAAAG
ncbi:MAG TPA: methionine--tRNA ligase [Candidatus Limnocylindrales bacterium]|nr:methionine--tRNA ligase [Candidatus Limnocylindrales bacterium]